MRSIKELLRLSEKVNIAKDMDEQRLAEIGAMCKDAYTDDLGTCQERFQKLNEYTEIAKQVVTEKNHPWPKAANVKYPILTTAAIQFNARAYPALIPSGKIVNARVFGDDPDGSKAERGKRVSSHMSYQLSYSIEDWQEQMDTLFIRLPIVASMYKKTFFDTDKNRVSSSLLDPQQIVINNDTTKTIETCPRVTEVISRYPYQIKNNISKGLWIDIDKKYDDEDKQKPVEILEQHVLLSLDDSENREHYIVTMDSETGNIFRIKACYDEDTIFVDIGGEYKSIGKIKRDIETKNITIRKNNMMAQAAAQKANTEPIVIKEVPMLDVESMEAVCVEKKQYYTEYWFLPSIDGKYLKYGLADLVASLTGTVDTTINQMLDAGTLANTQGGLRQKVGKIKSGPIEIGPGCFPEVETGGVPLRDSIYQFKFPGPSPVLFNLLGMIIDAARDITGVKDIMVGDAPQGETATTTMIKREEGMRVFTAIYKRLYRSMSREFKKIYNVNKEYLTQDEYFRFGDSDMHVQKEDYEDDSIDIMPVADPNESTMQDRVFKAQALFNFMGDPDADQKEIKKNYIVAMGFSDKEFERFFPGAPPAGPNPEVEKINAEIALLEAQTKEVLAKISTQYATVLEKIANAESKEAGTQIEQYKAIAEGIQNGFTGQQGRIAGLVESPGDETAPEGMAPEMGQPGEGTVLAEPELMPEPGSGGDAIGSMPGLQQSAE